MRISRRSVVSAGLGVGLLPGLADFFAYGQSSGGASGEFDQATFDFWTKQVRQPSQAFERTGRLPLPSKSVAPTPAEVAFLYFDPTQKSFESATTAEFGEKGLLDKGDAVVSLSVDTLRLSTQHQQIVQHNGTGSLRVDLKQGKPLKLLTETLNWSAIGSFQGKGQEFHTINFDPKSTWGGSQQVPLASGIGFWAWNFSVQRGASKWSQLLQSLSTKLQGSSAAAVKGASSAASASTPSTPNSTSSSSGLGLSSFASTAVSVLGFGLPAVAQTATLAIDRLYAFLHSQGGSKPDPVFQMPDTPLIATAEARQAYSGRAINLKPGTYIVLPSTAVSEVASGKYTLGDYGLVPSETKSADYEDAMASTLTQVSYCAISIDVSIPS